ncbi:MAG TPA: PQQ-binding-like beta-propeller repeat protein [Polyangiaceae bacterium]
MVGPRDSGSAGGEDAGVLPLPPEDAAADASEPFVPVDAGPASSFGVDPAHDNCVLDASIASPLKPAWTASFDGGVTYPVVVGDRAIVAVNEAEPNLRALDLATGALDWGPLVVGGSVMLAAEGTTVFALTGSGELFAYDATSGHALWSTQLQGQIDFWSPPVASGGLVYVNGLESGGTTYAINASNGQTAWTADTFDGSEGTVAVLNGVVYEAEACDQVSAFDAYSGALHWYHSTSCTGGGGTTPAAYGNEIWVRDTPLGNVILDTGGAVKGSFNGNVLPAFHDGTVFYANGTNITAVDLATSMQKWTFAGDAEICTAPVVAGASGQVFVGSRSGNVYELDEATGAQRSVNDAGAAVVCGSETTSMGMAPGRLLVPVANGLVAY